MTNEEILGMIVLYLIAAVIGLAALYYVIRLAVVHGLRAHAFAEADGSLAKEIARRGPAR